MQENEENLVELGLSPSEAKVYLVGLTLDSTTVADLAHHTGIKRPTLYHALSELIEKGLAAESRKGGKLYFVMSPPSSIKTLLERQAQKLALQKQKLDDLIPTLASIQKKKKGDDVGVVTYHGIEGMKMVMDIAFACKSKRWDVIAPYKNFLREYDPEYAKQYLSARKYHGITSRALWEQPEPSKDGTYSDRPLTPEERRDRNPRLMPWVMQGKFKSMMFLFDDKVAIFSSLDRLSAILITSQEIKDLYQAMFDGIWEFSEAF
jgi:predicted transcriptional regulator